MKNLNPIPVRLVVLSLSLLFLAGCGGEQSSAKNEKKESSGGHVHADGSSHGDHDHKEKDHSKEGHAHDAGPHGGTMVDWGGGIYHLEFTVDHDKKQSTVYVFGSDEKTPAPIDAKKITLSIKDPEFTTALEANPQQGDSAGKSSRFIGTHESLAIVKEYQGSLSGSVNHTPYSGNFEEKAHQH